jgi:glucokinase
MTIDKDGPICNCGNTGCLESIASGTAITRRAREAITAGHYFKDQPDLPLADQLQYADPQAVAQAAKEGLPAARAIIRDAAEGLGIGIVNILHIFNPEKIIMGGGLLQVGEMLLNPAMQLVRERTMKVPGEAVQIVDAQLGDDTGLIGAGALIYYNTRNSSSSGTRQRRRSVSTGGSN